MNSWNNDRKKLLQNPEKRTIIPTEYMGVKLVSFGFAGQGRAIMRGPMVSGVIDQLLTTAEWYDVLSLRNYTTTKIGERFIYL